MYIDIGRATSDTATLNFAFGTSTTVTTSRIWDVKVAQIPCDANYA